MKYSMRDLMRDVKTICDPGSCDVGHQVHQFALNSLMQYIF